MTHGTLKAKISSLAWLFRNVISFSNSKSRNLALRDHKKGTEIFLISSKYLGKQPTFSSRKTFRVKKNTNCFTLLEMICPSKYFYWISIHNSLMSNLNFIVFYIKICTFLFLNKWTWPFCMLNWLFILANISII